MKKIWITMICAILIFCTYSCNKKLPTEPSYPTQTFTLTPNATQTAIAVCVEKTVIATIPYTALASVPGGTFDQKDAANDFIHTISSFQMGKYEVTYELWFTVYQWGISHGYTFQNQGTEGIDGVAGDAPTSAKHEPATAMNWRDSIVWCNAFSEMIGLIPVYYHDSAFTQIIRDSTNGEYSMYINLTPGSYDNPFVNWNTNGYRLPTEGEWQYAASYIDGSTWTPQNYASGAVADALDATATGAVAWYIGNSSGDTQDVGTKMPNALGIYDM